MKRAWTRVGASDKAASPGVNRTQNGFGFNGALIDLFPPDKFPRIDVYTCEDAIGFKLGDAGAAANPQRGKHGVRLKAFGSLPRWEGVLPIHTDDPDMTFYVVLPDHEKATEISLGENPRPGSSPVLEPEPPGFEEASPPVLKPEPPKPKGSRKGSLDGSPTRPYRGPDLSSFNPLPYLPGGIRCIAASPAQLANIALAAVNQRKRDAPLGGDSVVDAVALRFQCNKAALARFLTEFGPWICYAEALDANGRTEVGNAWDAAFGSVAPHDLGGKQ